MLSFVFLCSMFSLSSASLSLSKNELPNSEADFVIVPHFHSDLLEALASAVALSDRHQFTTGFSDTSEKPMKHFEERRHFNEITAEMPIRAMRRGGEEFLA